MARSKSNKRWIQDVVENPKFKKGQLSHDLGIPEEKNIPLSLLRKIKQAPIGTTIKNPTKIGKSSIKITKKIKNRSVFAFNLKQLGKKKKEAEYGSIIESIHKGKSAARKTAMSNLEKDPNYYKKLRRLEMELRE